MIRDFIALLQASRKSLVGASFLVAQPLLLNALSIPATAYIISSLGPLGYGQWAIALSLLTSTSMLTNLGVRAAFVRRVSRDHASARGSFAEQLGLRLVLGAFAGAVSLSVCAALGYPSIVLQCTLLLAIGGVFSAAGTVVADVLTAMERLPSMAAINGIAGLSLTVASVAAIWSGAGPFGLALSYLLGPMLTALLSLALVQRQLFPVRVSWDVRRWGSLLYESRVLGFQLFIVGLDAQAANLLVPKLVGIASYGYFAAGTLLPTRLLVIPDGLNDAFFPVLARSHAEGLAAFRRSVKRFCILAGVAGLGAAVPVFLLAGPIARLLFPNQPEICRTIIQLTIWIVPLFAIQTAVGYSLNAAYREAAESRVSFIATVISLCATVGLIVWFGLLGAAAALLVKGALNCVFRIPVLMTTLRAEATETRPAAGVA